LFEPWPRRAGGSDTFPDMDEAKDVLAAEIA
jgi:hypothetical protein